jgi:cytochrome b
MPETRVWDLPTRLFHWLLVAAFLCSWITAENGWMDVHFISGYCILGLVVFRIIWGLIGSTTSRFSQFLSNPINGIRYLGRLPGKTPELEFGHSPSGGWMVLIMLGLLLAQAVMGLFASDELLYQGPLSQMLSSSQAEEITEIHEELGELLPWLIGLHVAVVLWIVWRKKEPILRAMLTGRRPDLPEGSGEGARFVSTGVALVIAAAVAAAVIAMVRLS